MYLISNLNNACMSHCVIFTPKITQIECFPMSQFFFSLKAGYIFMEVTGGVKKYKIVILLTFNIYIYIYVFWCSVITIECKFFAGQLLFRYNHELYGFVYCKKMKVNPVTLYSLPLREIKNIKPLMIKVGK